MHMPKQMCIPFINRNGYCMYKIYNLSQNRSKMVSQLRWVYSFFLVFFFCINRLHIILSRYSQNVIFWKLIAFGEKILYVLQNYRELVFIIDILVIPYISKTITKLITFIFKRAIDEIYFYKLTDFELFGFKQFKWKSFLNVI